MSDCLCQLQLSAEAMARMHEHGVELTGDTPADRVIVVLLDALDAAQTRQDRLIARLDRAGVAVSPVELAHTPGAPDPATTRAAVAQLNAMTGGRPLAIETAHNVAPPSTDPELDKRIKRAKAMAKR